jgi:hypothetical protein
MLFGQNPGSCHVPGGRGHPGCKNLGLAIKIFILVTKLIGFHKIGEHLE